MIDEINVNSWEEFEKELPNIRYQIGDSNRWEDLPVLFRGQADSDWSLSSTLDRVRPTMSFQDYYRMICNVRPQVESLTGREWPIPEHSEIVEWTQQYDEFSMRLTFGKFPAYAFMIYLRHHGFPSPLLDWTHSPYVAAYFAFRNAVAAPGKNVSIFTFSEALIGVHGNHVPEVHKLGQYVRTHRRHFLQQCDYTMCIRFDSDWRFEGYERALNAVENEGIFVWKINIPATERLKVLRLLDKHNLNAFSLFGSEESLMEAMALRELWFSESNSLSKSSGVAGGWPR